MRRLFDLQPEHAHECPIHGRIGKEPTSADGTSPFSEQIEGGTVDRVTTVQHTRLSERIECNGTFHNEVGRDSRDTKKNKDSLGESIRNIFFL